jgi:hypothetical protein
LDLEARPARRTSMRRAWPCLAVLAVAGCGGSATAPPDRPADAAALSADGIGIDLPDGWTGRILIGASGRPVLHAASYPVEANDTDEGLIAQEAMGVNGMYLNVRALGSGDSASPLPVHFDASDFRPSSFEGGPRSQASVDVTSGGEGFRVSAVSGGDAPPAPRYLDQLNDALGSLWLANYTPQRADPPIGKSVTGFGLHVNVPEGWEGGIGRGEVHAGDGSVDLTISEFSAPEAAGFVTGRLPLTIGPAEFIHMQGGSGYETGRSFLDAGRQFQLWVRSPDPRPSTAELERVNAFLASFHAEPGDFYPGRVEPATFGGADGWHTGSSGAAEIQPDGQQTMSWASTIPYRDSGLQFAPHETLAALPPDGIVLTVRLDQHGSKGGPPVQPPFRLSDFREGTFEGLDPENGPRSFGGRYGNYDVEVWVLFGREHPTQEQLDRAQGELDRLELPKWPRWDATSAER